MSSKQRKPWIIPKLWPGSTVYIIGGGPSLTDMELDCLIGKRVIGVNQAFRKYPWVDVTYFGDCQFRELAPIDSWPGLKITSCGRVPELGNGWPGYRRVGRSKPYGIETKKRGFISWNGNSGASAINIAYWFGATRVVLLGFDMHVSDNNQHNFHDYYPRRAENFDPYKNHMRGWPVIAREAREIGLEIINATPNSSITDFIYKPLEELI